MHGQWQRERSGLIQNVSGGLQKIGAEGENGDIPFVITLTLQIHILLYNHCDEHYILNVIIHNKN